MFIKGGSRSAGPLQNSYLCSWYIQRFMQLRESTEYQR